ncbi:MAG: uroporphyrinogen-III synthase [Aliishimia sp.]
MPNPYATVMLTRPHDASLRFAQDLMPMLNAETHVIISPLLKIVPVISDHDLNDYAGVIFTSSNGVLFGGPSGAHPAFCVGRETTRATRQAGWEAYHLGDTAEDIIATLIQQNPQYPLLHIGGRHKRNRVADRLTQAGLETHEAVVYDQVEQTFSPEAMALLDLAVDVIVPLFSPRTAKIFASQYKGCARLHFIAMSEAVSEEINAMQSISKSIARSPDALEMKASVYEALRRVEAGDAPL